MKIQLKSIADYVRDTTHDLTSDEIVPGPLKNKSDLQGRTNISNTIGKSLAARIVGNAGIAAITLAIGHVDLLSADPAGGMVWWEKAIVGYFALNAVYLWAAEDKKTVIYRNTAGLAFELAYHASKGVEFIVDKTQSFRGDKQTTQQH